MADNSGDQAIASQRAANAAKSAANTAKESLRISERAYLGVSDPEVLPDLKEIRFQVRNIGRIPSGNVVVTTHRAIFYTADISAKTLPFAPIEAGWGSTHKPPVFPNASFVDLDPFNSIDKEQFIGGHQIIVIAGVIEYGDGFIGDGKQKSSFCFQTQRYIATGERIIIDCDVNIILPKLIKLDHYPIEGDNQHTNQ